MESSLIEKLDKSRYSLIMWLTIGWTVWYGTYLAKDLIDSQLVNGCLFLIGSIGWILFIVNLVKTVQLGKKVRSDARLKEALNNEMHQLYNYKSFFWGFCVVIATTTAFLVISSFYVISALIVSELTLFIGILSSFIAWLVYNKD